MVKKTASRSLSVMPPLCKIPEKKIPDKKIVTIQKRT
jgi:hypothetical protein